LLVLVAGCGRVGFDERCVPAGAPVAHDRSASWQGGTMPGSTQGNPSAAVDGVRWSYEWTTGDALAAATPWHLQPGTPMVWDDDWFGQGGVWAYDDDLAPLIAPTELTQGFEWEHIALLRMTNADTTPRRVEVSGTITLRWRGFDGATPSTAPIDVDLVVAHLDPDAREHAAFAVTVAKPTPDTSVEEVAVEVPGSIMVLDPGESMVTSLRPLEVAPVEVNAWVTLTDDAVAVELTPCR
jgi:hypothetical protein